MKLQALILQVTLDRTGNRLWGAGSRSMSRWVIGLVLAAYFALAVAYSLGIPAWEAPDEPSHYLYAEYLAEHGSLPPKAAPQRAHFRLNGYVTSLYEWYQPPLYYALVAPQIVLADRLMPGTIPQAFPPLNPVVPGETHNLFAAETDPAFDAPGLRLARWFSVALGLCTLYTVYRATMVASGDDRAVALTATGMMAFIPQYTFLSGYVTNDNLALMLSALSMLAFLHLLKAEGGLKQWQVAGTGLLLAVGLYTKLSLLVLLPLGLFCLMLRATAHRSVRQWLLESSILTGAAMLPFLLGLPFLPGLRDQVTYAYASFEANPDYLSLKYLAGLWPLTRESFWARFGWMNVSAPAWVATAMTAIAFLGLVGGLVPLGPQSRRYEPERLKKTLALLWSVCGLIVLGFLRFNLTVRQPQGRLLFTALPALIMLVALGYRRLSGRYYGLVGSGIVLFTLVANVVCLFGALLPAYASPS